MNPVEPPPSAAPPLNEPVLTPARRLRLSWVWLVPIVALLIAAGLVVRSFLQAGPLIVIEFRSAEGLEAGRTEVRFKEVVVGRVTKVSLHPDRKKVRVQVRLDKSVESLAVQDTRFWVVRPRIGSAGISGLSTLLSGAYIGVDAGASEDSSDEFIGLDTPPLLLRGEPGRSFVMQADDLGSLDVGTPVYYRRIRAGRVVGYSLDEGGRSLLVQVFIEAPHDKLVTKRTRFWNASGIELALTPSGLTVTTQSLASVLAGGIAFGSANDATPEPTAPAGGSFKLYATERAAQAADDGDPVRVRMVFSESLRGLEVGAPIDLLGIELGTVRDIALHLDPARQRFAMTVSADVYPRRMGVVRGQFQPPPGATGPRDALLLAQLVEQGLRAQVRSGNLLTGRLYVALDFIPQRGKDAARARIDTSAEVLTLPTVAGSLNDMQSQLSETLERLSKVRFDEIASGLKDTLKSASGAGTALQLTLQGADATIRRLTPEAQRSLAELQQTLAAAQRALGSAERNVADVDAPLQRQAGQTLAELQRAAQAMRVLADYLQRHPESLLRGKPADAEPAAAAEPRK